MSNAVIHLLRVALGLILAIALLGQVFVIPFIATEFALSAPDLAHLAVPYAIISILAIGCVEVALIAVWALLGRVRGGSIFSRAAYGWVDTVIWSAAAATVLTAALLLWHAGVELLGPPAFLGLLLCTVIGGIAFILLMVVMRRLLRLAAEATAELAEVI